jgi:hypothetical protein
VAQLFLRFKDNDINRLYMCSDANVLMFVHETCSSQVIPCEDYSLEGCGIVVYLFQSIHIFYQYYTLIFMQLTSMQYILQCKQTTNKTTSKKHCNIQVIHSCFNITCNFHYTSQSPINFQCLSMPLK